MIVEGNTVNTVLNKKILSLIVCFGLASSLLPVAFAQGDGPLKILMVTGGGPWHDYATQKDQITNGLLDPWSSQSVTVNASESLIAINIPDGSHHSDLGAPPNPTIQANDSPALKAARAQQLVLLRSWLERHHRATVASAPGPAASKSPAAPAAIA